MPEGAGGGWGSQEVGLERVGEFGRTPWVM